MHEPLVDHAHAPGPSDRSFGLTVGGIFAVLGALRLWLVASAGAFSIGMIAGGLLLVIIGLVQPAILAPLNKLWMKLGLLLAKIVNPLVMLLIYVIIFVPVAFIMRLKGRDPLRRALDPNAKSYWIERTPPGPAPEGMPNQF